MNPISLSIAHVRSDAAVVLRTQGILCLSQV